MDRPERVEHCRMKDCVVVYRYAKSANMQATVPLEALPSIPKAPAGLKMPMERPPPLQAPEATPKSVAIPSNGPASLHLAHCNPEHNEA